MRLVILLACVLAVSAHADELVQKCLDSAKPAEDEEIQVDLKKDCPSLFKALQQQGLIAAAEPKLIDKVSESQLGFLAGNSQPHQQARQLNRNDLDKLLAGIRTDKTPESKADWWHAVLKWLDSLKTGDYESEYKWFMAILAKIVPSEQTIRYFFNTLMVLLVLLSGCFILHECYRAGLFQKMTSKSKITKGKRISVNENYNSSILKRLPTRELAPKQQIAGLLEQVIQHLIEHKVVPAETNLTLRQMLAYVGKQPGEIRQVFARLVNQAEPVLYGDRAVDMQMLDCYWQDAQQLLGKPVV